MYRPPERDNKQLMQSYLGAATGGAYMTGCIGATRTDTGDTACIATCLHTHIHTHTHSLTSNLQHTQVCSSSTHTSILLHTHLLEEVGLSIAITVDRHDALVSVHLY